MQKYTKGKYVLYCTCTVTSSPAVDEADVVSQARGEEVVDLEGWDTAHPTIWHTVYTLHSTVHRVHLSL